MNIDRNKIIEALVKCDVGPVAKEAAGPLIDAWLERLPTFEDTAWPTLAVETGWYLRLDPKTLIVGQCDRLMRDPDGNLVLGEWKTRREVKITKAGVPYKGDTEQDWLEEIAGGPQLSVYALALRDGWFPGLGEDIWCKYSAIEPRVLVRAVTKNQPPLIWPTRQTDGIFTFPPAALDATRNALLVKAAQVRAARATGLVPYQLRGFHCRSYGRVCGYYDDCTNNRFPPAGNVAWHPTDPGFEVPRLLGLDATDPDLVILSQSSYQTLSTCAEKYRRSYGGHGDNEESFELQVGTAFHAAIAALYVQMMTLG